MSTPPPPPPGDHDPHRSGGPDDPAGQSFGHGSSQAPDHGSNQAPPSYGSGGYGAESAGYQGAPGYYGGSPGNERDNNLGVIALVTGIISLIICQPVGVVAIVYGRRAQQAAQAGTANNGTMGVVGFWLGVAAIVLLVVAVVLAIVLVAVGVLSLAAFVDATSTSP